MAPKKWIAGAIKHPGALHRDLGVAKGKTIPRGKLQAAANRGGTVGRRARMAMTLRKMNPWEVVKEGDGWWVVKEGTREKVHKQPHKSREDAIDHMKALYSAEGIGEADKKIKNAKVGRLSEVKSSPAAFRGY